MDSRPCKVPQLQGQGQALAGGPRPSGQTAATNRAQQPRPTGRRTRQRRNTSRVKGQMRAARKSVMDDAPPARLR